MNIGSAAVMDGDAVSTPAVSEVAISYGVFINTFIIVAQQYEEERRRETCSSSGSFKRG